MFTQVISFDSTRKASFVPKESSKILASNAISFSLELKLLSLKIVVPTSLLEQLSLVVLSAMLFLCQQHFDFVWGGVDDTQRHRDYLTTW